FLSTSSSYSPLDLDSSSRTVTVRGRVVTGTRSFNIPEPVTLSFAEFQSTAFIVASSEVGGTRIVTSLVGIGAGEAIVGSIYPSPKPVVYGASQYTVGGLHQGRDTVGVFNSTQAGLASTWPNDHFWTLPGSGQNTLTLWRNESGVAERIKDIEGTDAKYPSVSYTLALNTRTELADFNFAGNVIHHGSMRVVMDGSSRVVSAQDIALDESRSKNQTHAVVLNPDTLELSTIRVASVTPSS